MKTILTITLIALCTSIGFAQQTNEVTRTVKFDYLTGKISGTEKVKQGHFVTIHVENINLLKYELLIGKGIRNYPTEPSQGIATLLGIKNENTDKTTENAEAVADSEAALNSMKEVKKESDVSNIKNEMETLVEACTELIELSKEIAQLHLEKQILIQISETDWKDFESLDQALAEVYPNAPDVKIMSAKVTAYLTGYEKAKVAYEVALEKAMKSKVEAEIKALLAKEGKTEELSFETLIEIQGKMAEAMDKIDKAKENIKEAYETLEETDLNKVVRDISSLYKNLKSESNFKKTSLPIQMEGDYLYFDISVKPKGDPIAKPSVFSFEIAGKGGWKRDFSLGPAFSFGKGAKDDLHFLETNTDTTSILRRKSNHNAFRPGLASMVHLQLRSGSSTNIGFSFGVGAQFKTLDDPDLSYYTGLTLVTGKKDKFFIATGVSFLRVDRFSEQYLLDKSYPTDVITVAGVTDKVFRPSLFLYLSYSIAKKVDSNKVSQK